MAQDIKLFKLVNGDMALGKWDENNNKIKDPANLQMIPTQQGGVQMALLPFGYPFDNEIGGEIDGRHIMYEYQTVPQELVDKYTEASSNLTISSANDLKNLENMAGSGGNISDFSKFLK
ncbi:MAG: hypothetical protein ACQES5_00575 [Thermodesulfobacteriota bacterium]